MKILSPSQLQKTDAYTIKHEKITSWQLMERASLEALAIIKEILVKTQPVTILAGSGNNGGDGLAIAFHLDNLGYEVNILLLKFKSEYSKDCKINLERLKSKTSVKINEYSEDSPVEDSELKPVIVDAIFGIGLNRTLPVVVQNIIKSANKSNSIRISIDVPSGLFLSKVTPPDSVVFKANYTLTFQCPKLNFFLPDYGNYIGKIKIIDIGLNQKFISELTSDYEYLDEAYAKNIYKTRERFSHKGNYGHLLIIGGQFGMMGSVCLTTKAALKSGLGKVSVVSPKCGVNVLQQSIPEAMVLASDENDVVTPVQPNFKPNHICIGMGIGTSELAKNTLEHFIKIADSPLLIDADGINLLAQNEELLVKLPKKTILTPHQGELKRLIGEWSDEYDKLGKMKKFVDNYDLVLVSKDAYTFIVERDKTYINSTGNAGMATAGSGDVLSGVISGLLVQNYSSLEASILGVFLHGKAADIYSETKNRNTLIASDIIDYLSLSFF
jgi:hydroxyethylthiazole kinase-like uncharacterized protein yjeF